MPGPDRASLFPSDLTSHTSSPARIGISSPSFFRTPLSLIIFAAPDLALYRHTRLCSDVHVMPGLSHIITDLSHVMPGSNWASLPSPFPAPLTATLPITDQRRTTKRHNSLRHTTKTLFHTPKPPITQRISPLPAASRIIPHMNNISTF